ncbi:hypothetical protein [Fimbriimonas ginsengisoli]|uniref:Uncharacterized protein n=1 Tax=Fimbriimonas ginsengisoli Gsoil 348 TaxID=661478 RepID=A0A068NQ70_FIMGI|nr:hypothetical protein [Fimbriimonas ginsengisoli]AIE85512.1 hypothetical protein OP10G_2144 [Fimbriimonas ginsengisoli Gsoil 348]
MSDRLVFTLAFGARRFGEMAMGLGRSLSLIGDTTPRAILTDIDGFDWGRHFDLVIHKSVAREETFWAKLYALEVTDAQKILFIDGDSLVFKRLDPIFDAFEGASFGVQGIQATDGEWYDKDVREVLAAEHVSSLPKFNGGLLYYERTPETARLIQEARAIGERYDEIGWRRNANRHSKGVIADEPCIGLAIAKTGIGRVAPDTENFHNSAVGLVGRLRMDVRRAECRYLCRRYDLQYVEPYIFHAHLYSKFLVYWRQLAYLEKFDRYADRHPFGYMSFWHKQSRSIQRRWLKTVWRIR